MPTEFTATRRCLESGTWSLPDVSNCQSTEFIELESKINLTTTDVMTLLMYTSELSNITDTEQAILPKDVVTASNILTKILE